MPDAIRHPEVIKYPGFRIALRAHGMTKKGIATQPPSREWPFA